MIVGVLSAVLVMFVALQPHFVKQNLRIIVQMMLIELLMVWIDRNCIDGDDDIGAFDVVVVAIRLPEAVRLRILRIMILLLKLLEHLMMLMWMMMMERNQWLMYKLP